MRARHLAAAISQSGGLATRSEAGPRHWTDIINASKENIMHTHDQKTEHKSFSSPEEVRNFPNGKAEILTVGGAEVGRLVFNPGWRWSNDVKPHAKTSSCEAPHFQYHVSGKLAIRMDDGTEFVAGPGDITSLPKGHDAWVVGDEAVVVVDWFGASNYAKQS
jgi:hypothetical protein